jgi:hypothetical protein
MRRRLGTSGALNIAACNQPNPAVHVGTAAGPPRPQSMPAGARFRALSKADSRFQVESLMTRFSLLRQSQAKEDGGRAFDSQPVTVSRTAQLAAEASLHRPTQLQRSHTQRVQKRVPSPDLSLCSSSSCLKRCTCSECARPPALIDESAGGRARPAPAAHCCRDIVPSTVVKAARQRALFREHFVAVLAHLLRAKGFGAAPSTCGEAKSAGVEARHRSTGSTHPQIGFGDVCSCA